MSWPPTALSPAPTVASQAADLGQYLEDNYVEARGGKVRVMESMWHLWEEILNAADEPTVLVCCTGETPRGPFPEQDAWHMVDRQWSVVVLRGHGFRNLHPQADGNPPNGADPMTTTIEEVRELVRAKSGLSEEFPVNYKGWDNLPAVARPGTANVFVAGAVIKFQSANYIPLVTETA